MWYKFAYNEDENKYLYSKNPSDFFRNNSLKEIFKEIYQLQNIPQDPKHHPEGDVFEHTMQAMDAASKIADRENLSQEDRKILILSSILHDIGKLDTTSVKLKNGEIIPINEYRKEYYGPGKIISYGHDLSSIKKANIILDRLNLSNEEKDKVLTLILLHMRPTMMSNVDNITEKALKKLKDKLSNAGLNPSMLMYLNEADLSRNGKEYPDKNRLLFNKINNLTEQEEVKKVNNNIQVNIIKDMIDKVFIDKEYDKKLLTKLMKISSDMANNGQDQNDIINKIKEIILKEYNNVV